MKLQQATTRLPIFSLRLKLTLWMTLIFLVVQLSLVFVFQLYQRRSIEAFFDARILARQVQLAAELRPILGSASSEQLRDVAERYRRELLQRSFVIELFDDKGAVLASSLPSQAPLSADAWKKVQRAPGPIVIPSSPEIIRASGVNAARSAAGVVIGSDGHKYTLLVGWSDTNAQEMLQLLSGVMFLSVPIGVIAVLISAYAISGVAIQPISAMRQMARGLDPEYLGVEVPVWVNGTEMAELQQDLEKTRRKLEAAFGSQERFMSNVSHELKTPISVALTEAQTLKLDNATPEVRAFISSIVDELLKLGRLVDSFLVLTRVRHGKATIPNQELCLIREIMLSSYEGCSPMAAQYGVRIDFTLPELAAEDAGVLGNCDLLRTVVDNLLRNAIRFSPKGQVVELRAHVDNDHLLITVRDHGQGIPPDLLPHIFDRFSQAKEQQRRGRGHGLGLEIALGITELHGGSIAVRNHDGGGCEFIASLPLVVRTPAQAAPANVA